MEDIRTLNPFRLGFGLMRLPKNPDGSKLDAALELLRSASGI